MPELIDKQAALDIAMSYCPDDDGCCSKAGQDIREMLDEIEALPIVHIDDLTLKIQNEIQAAKPSRTVEITFVRHGRWIFGSSKTSCWMTCSICCKSQSGQTATFSYCPNCGARMDGGAENV